MRCSFVNLAFLFDDRQRAKSAELSFEHGARIEIFDFFRAARAVFQLFRRVALDDHQTAGFEGLSHSGPLLHPFGRGTELGEDFGHHIERGARISPAMDVDSSKVTSTWRSAANALALRCAAGEKSIETTSRPCSASQTPLRPSPSATANARPVAGSSGLQDCKK